MDSNAYIKFKGKDKIDILEYITKQILKYKHNKNIKDSNISEYIAMFKYLVCRISSNSELSLIYESKVIDMVNASGDSELFDILEENKVHLFIRNKNSLLNYIMNYIYKVYHKYNFYNNNILNYQYNTSICSISNRVTGSNNSNNPDNTESNNSSAISIRSISNTVTYSDSSNSSNNINHTFFINSSNSITLEEHEEFINRRIGI